jgi:predicted glycoside hydrolase/deacetylase ChbG (UPF0249 family)
MIITADDVGLSPAVTRGALETARLGVVRSVSIIVNMPESEDAAAEARSIRGLELGLHLNVLAGRPVSDPATVRSLLDENGEFLRLGELARRLARGGVRAGELARELRAQVERARRLGTPAQAWDSHRHVHLVPPVARVVAALARELGARYVRRAPLPPARVGRVVAKRTLLAALSRASAPFYRGIAGNDWYVDLSTWSPAPQAADIAALALLTGVGELGAHPGYVDDLLAARDALVAERERERRLLCDARLLMALGEDLVRHRVP